MAIEDNKAAVRRFWEGFNRHTLDAWDEVCTPNFMNHDPGLPTPQADLPTLKQTIGGLLAAFPDLRASEEDLIAEGDKVAVRNTFRGTHQGAWLGSPATGKQVTFTGSFIAQLTGGKIAEQWVNFDALGLLQQLGVVPQTAQGGA